MRILSIETSCDETAISIVEVDEDRRVTVLSDEILSQASLHAQYGGVFPAMAKREHARVIAPLLLLSLKQSGMLKAGASISLEKKEQIEKILEREQDLAILFLKDIATLERPNIDRIAFTRGPGLEPALWVGINFARALALLWDIPLVPVNHMEGHILSALFDAKTTKLPVLEYPILALLISGGHTELVRMDGIGTYTLLGETQDDAVGECFDKVARMLGLPYPGGPEVATLALHGKPGIYPLPRPMIHSHNLDFSFSGLKTSVLYLVKKLGTLEEQTKKDIAREFEDAVVDVLVSKSKVALSRIGAKGLVIGGGVSANVRIREGLKKLCDEEGVDFFAPSKGLSTDNAFMIALAGIEKNVIPPTSSILAEGHWKIHS